MVRAPTLATGAQYWLRASRFSTTKRVTGRPPSVLGAPHSIVTESSVIPIRRIDVGAPGTPATLPQENFIGKFCGNFVVIKMFKWLFVVIYSLLGNFVGFCGYLNV